MTSKVGLVEIPFTGGFYATRSKPLSSQRLINWYVNAMESGGLNKANVYATSGLKQAVAAAGGINRGAWVMNNIPYFVNGQTLYRMNRVVDINGNVSYTSTSIGTIAGTGRVIMDSVKLQLCIVVPGVSAQIYTEGGSLTTITDPDFDGPVDDVVAIASVFVFIKTNSNKVFHSALNDGLSYNALDFYTVNQIPVAVGLIAHKNQLYVMGRNAIVPFSNVGGQQFLFAPQPNSVISTGVRSKYLKSTFLDSFVFIGSGINAEISIWLYQGGAPERISTEPLDYLIQNSTDEEIENAYVMRHSQNGADFIVIKFGSYCFKYDRAASLRIGVPIWHEQRSTITVNGFSSDNPWRVTSIIQAYNRAFVGDSVDGRIGELADDIGTEYGGSILRVLITQPLSNQGVKTKARAIEVFTDVGVSTDDVMNLSWSNDGGFTFGSKLSRSLGAIGEYGRRVQWTRLGAFSIARSLRIEYSGQYPRGINKIMANAI